MIDPISAIVATLAAGAIAATKDTASQAIKDAYAGLKALIQRRFANKPEGQTALEQHEQKPQVWEAPLADALKEVGADQDQDIIGAVQHLKNLLSEADSSAVAPGSRAMVAGGNISDVAYDQGRVVKPYFAGSVTGSTANTAGGDISSTPAPTSSAGMLDLFAPVLMQVRARPANPDVDIAEILQTVEHIRDEAALGQSANPNKIERWLGNLAAIAPDIRDAVVRALQSSMGSISEAVRQVVARATK